MSTLVLVRHGKTEWSSQNRFAGWADAPLSPRGEREARTAGHSLSSAGFTFDFACTSYLSRAARSLEIILTELQQADLPVERSWRLNERHYGRLQGHNRTKMALEYGNDQVGLWRRDFHAEPPPLLEGDPRLPTLDPIYDGIDPTLLPVSESLEQAARRVEPWWHDALAPRLRDKQTILVVAHTSSIRGLVRQIEGLDGEAAAAFRIATALPLIYTFDDHLRVTGRRELVSGGMAQVRRLLNRYKPGKLISWV